MLKRSFGFKDRAGKATKPVKRSFRDDAKLKLMEQLAHPSSPPSAVYVSCFLCQYHQFLSYLLEPLFCLRPSTHICTVKPLPGSTVR